MSSTAEIEPPECPVCLQPYDTTTIVPRVISCGHSVCQTCLSLLPQPFPNTIRCPSCTQLVKLTHPSSLPKNIDLLRFSSLLQYPLHQITDQPPTIGSLTSPPQYPLHQNPQNPLKTGSLTSPDHQITDKPQNIGSLASFSQYPHHQNPLKTGSLTSPDHQITDKPQNIGSLASFSQYPHHQNPQNPLKIGSLTSPDHQNPEKAQKIGSLASFSQYPHHQNPENPLKIGSLPSPDHQNPEKAQKIGSLTSFPQYPHHRNPENPLKFGSLPYPDYRFVPNLWTQEFFLKWKKWVVSENDVVLLDSNDKDGFFSTLHGRCLVEGGSENVSLVRIGSFDNLDDMRLRYSYVSKVMWVLHRMEDEERDELGLIFQVSSLGRVCKVYGLWYSDDDRSLYMVSERHLNNFWEDVTSWRNVFFGKYPSDELFRSSSFAMIGMEICEAISDLRSKGLFFGCLTIHCFCFDEFGHVYIDLNETLVASRRIGKLVRKVIGDKGNVHEPEFSSGNDASNTFAFVSPEIFLGLLKKNGVDIECEIKLDIGHGSDVWSLACVLLTLLCGESFLKLITVEGADYTSIYRGWREKVEGFLEGTMVSEIESLQENLCNCLFLDPSDRPFVLNIWKCIRGLFIKPQYDIVASKPHVDKKVEKEEVCLFWGELCKLGGETDKSSGKKSSNGLQNEDENGKDDVQVVGKSKDLLEGISEGHIRSMDLKGHLDCVTGLAVGGGFLFSSSYDKTVQVWSLQDFAHVHTFRGHGHKVMAIAFVDKEQPLCISGDGGGGIFIWDASIPLGQEPIKKLSEQKDWRYTGIHCLAVSGTEYLYTGSGDKSIKAWSLQDYTLSSVMNGHNSVVSTLAVCDGVLYSGSWDGTVRLWCLSDHSPLGVLGEAVPGNVTSVLSLAAYEQVLVVAHENGSVKIWRNDALLKCEQPHKGAIFSVSVGEKWLFTGGWDKAVNVKELLADDLQAGAISIGSIACNAVITALYYWQGKLFVGQADRVIKVFYYGS